MAKIFPFERLCLGKMAKVRQFVIVYSLVCVCSDDVCFKSSTKNAFYSNDSDRLGRR